jgi:hypothetical protein
MNQSLPQVAGSPIWQLAFVSFAVVLILFEILRGWRRGLARQLARLGALVAAYFAAFFGGNFIVPLVRPFLKLPDLVVSILAGAVLALVVYAVINSVGMILFKRTNQHASGFVRFFLGFGGAIVGLFFGAFLVWLIVVGVRSIGAVADAQPRQPATMATSGTPGRAVHAVDLRRGPLSELNEEQPSLLNSLARLKNSLELGAVGDVVKKADVVPTRTYETLNKISRVVANPQSAERFISYPGARELTEHPKIIALRNDEEISQAIEQGRLLDLLQNQKILDAMNDPTLIDEIKQFDLQRALDYAMQRD